MAEKLSDPTEKLVRKANPGAIETRSQKSTNVLLRLQGLLIANKVLVQINSAQEVQKVSSGKALKHKAVLPAASAFLDFAKTLRRQRFSAYEKGGIAIISRNKFALSKLVKPAETALSTRLGK